MELFQSYETIFYILFVITNIKSTVLAEYSPEEIQNAFLDHFTIIGNSFDAVYTLSKLTLENRNKICQRITNDVNIHSVDDIFVTRLDTESLLPEKEERAKLTNVNVSDELALSLADLVLKASASPLEALVPKPGMKPIPTFACLTDNFEEMFYVTHSKMNDFFVLKKTEKMTQEISVKISSLIEVPLDSSISENVEENLFNYFESDEYYKEAATILLKILDDKMWPKLCEIFYPGYEVPVDFNGELFVNFWEKIIYSSKRKSDLPFLKCPSIDKNNFYIGYFTSNVFFATQYDQEFIRSCDFTNYAFEKLNLTFL